MMGEEPERQSISQIVRLFYFHETNYCVEDMELPMLDIEGVNRMAEEMMKQ